MKLFCFLQSIDLHKKVYSKKDIMYISVLFLFYAMKSMYIHNMQRIFRFLKIKGCPQNNNVRCSLLCNFSEAFCEPRVAMLLHPESAFLKGQ